MTAFPRLPYWKRSVSWTQALRSEMMCFSCSQMVRNWAGSWTNPAESGYIDIDFSIFSQVGFTGLEIENAIAGTRYHTARDTADAISPNLMQGFGQAMLTLTNHFGLINFNTRSKNKDLDFFVLPFMGLLHTLPG